MAAEHTGPGRQGEVPVITGLPGGRPSDLSFPEVDVDLLVGDAYNEIPA
jgi:hypothetical protein